MGSPGQVELKVHLTEIAEELNFWAFVPVCSVDKFGWRIHEFESRQPHNTGRFWACASELVNVVPNCTMGLFKVRPGNGSKSPIVQFDTTTTQSQGKTLGPAVLVKTRVWVKGCSVSRVHKTWSRSFLFKDFQSQAPSQNGLFVFCIFELVQLIVPRIWKVVNFIPLLNLIRKY